MLQKHIYIYMRNIVWNIIFIKFHRNTYIYEEHRVEYPNCIWHFEENPKINSTKSHIYMRNIVWNIDFCKKLKQLSFWKRRACQKLKHLQFSTVPCLPKAYRNQANTSSLGIALWNICGISKSVLLRAFEALGAAVWRHAAAMLEAGLCSYFDLFLGAEGVA